MRLVKDETGCYMEDGLGVRSYMPESHFKDVVAWGMGDPVGHLEGRKTLAERWAKKANDDEWEKLRRLTGECQTCGGTGLVEVWERGVELVDCQECNREDDRTEAVRGR